MIKRAGQKDLHLIDGILQRIHDENPSYWPHGLSKDQFNGGLYLIQKSASAEPVGFVGWQHFDEGGRRVGYYAIGVLPEHRQQGFAKQAVAQVIREAGRCCDEVKAMIMQHNEPSKALARSLRVPILEKIAGLQKEATPTHPALRALLAVGSGAATAGLIDVAVNKDKGAIGRYALDNKDADPWSAADFGLNFMAGAAAPWRTNVALASALTGLAAGKTIATPAVRRMAERNDIFKDIANKLPEKQPVDQSGNAWDKIPRGVLLGAGGLGLGALGVMAYAAKRKADFNRAMLEEQGKGRVKITLPTKQPGDTETQVDIPFDELNLSKALRGRLSRDTKRRLHEETRARTKRRKPKNPEKPTEKEQEDMELEREYEELDKAAAIVALVDELFPPLKKSAAGRPAPQAAVPSPPQVGQNPALRMQQQQQAAAQPIAQTAANPQIEEARMQAMQAEQQAQQQAASVEQQAAATAMQQQQQFQQALIKAETEKETLKLQLEKTKAESELAQAKAKAHSDLAAAQAKGQADASSGEGTAVQRLTQSRIKRLQRRLPTVKVASTGDPTKLLPSERGWTPAPAAPPATPTEPGREIHGSSTTPGVLDPSTGKPIPPKPLILRPDAMNGLNKNPGATAVVPRVGLYRHSYGPIGDWFFDSFLKDRMMTGGTRPPIDLSPTAIANNPDKYSVIESLYRNGISQPVSNPFF